MYGGDSVPEVNDTFILRRVRPTIEGTFGGIYDFKFMPDFFEKYAQYMVEKARAAGATPEAVQSKLKELKKFKATYDNPFINALITFTEPFPVGLVMTLVSSLILRKR